VLARTKQFARASNRRHAGSFTALFFGDGRNDPRATARRPVRRYLWRGPVWKGDCPCCYSVRLAASIFIAAFIWRNPSLAGENDPFAAYRGSIEEQLTTMAAQPRMMAITPPVPPAAGQKPNSEDFTDGLAATLWNGRATDVRSATVRLQRYRPELESILESEGVPASLAAVVLVESGARPLALSPKQARGLWQLIPATARQYGLVVTADKDERIQLEMATRAAARYLRDLYSRFGDWPLALAAYNAGPETVDRAIQRGRTSDFSQLSAARLLPAETRNYVPAVFATMDLLGRQQFSSRTTPVKPVNILYAPASANN
jgi:hypothetical protein